MHIITAHKKYVKKINDNTNKMNKNKNIIKCCNIYLFTVITYVTLL